MVVVPRQETRGRATPCQPRRRAHGLRERRYEIVEVPTVLFLMVVVLMMTGTFLGRMRGVIIDGGGDSGVSAPIENVWA